MANCQCPQCREGEEVGSCYGFHGDQGFRRPVRVVRVAVHCDALCSGQSGRSRCRGVHGCGLFAARPASSFPWPPLGSCRHMRPCLHGQDHAPDPSSHHGCGCGGPGIQLRGRSLHVEDDCQGNNHGGGGRRLGHILVRCCSTRRPNWRKKVMLQSASVMPQ